MLYIFSLLANVLRDKEVKQICIMIVNSYKLHTLQYFLFVIVYYFLDKMHVIFKPKIINFTELLFYGNGLCK